MIKKHEFELILIIELDEDCKENPGDIFTEAVGEMQNKLNKVFPGGLGNPHVTVTYE